MSIYTVAHIVRLYCVIAFVDGVSFETLVLSVTYTKRASRKARREMGRAMSYRVVRVMPPVVVVLSLSGPAMVFDRYTNILRQPLASSFGTLLALKILPTFSVLVHFAVAAVKMHRRTLTVGWSKYIHAVVFTHMSSIVLLAKGMLYFSW